MQPVRVYCIANMIKYNFNKQGKVSTAKPGTYLPAATSNHDQHTKMTRKLPAPVGEVKRGTFPESTHLPQQ